MMIDPPDEDWGSTRSWQRFLESMEGMRGTLSHADDIAECDQWIETARRVLEERGMLQTQK